MTNLPIISVITIAFNDVEGLAKTISSVAAQDGVNIEHIIIDGGSTDGTKEYLANLQRPVKWVSEQDNGRYDAMNKGARMASGEILWFMHSSDVFHGAISARFVENQYRSSPFSWGYGLSNKILNGETKGIGGRVPFSIGHFLLGGYPIPHQASVVRRDFFLELGGFDEGFGLAADQLFFMKAAVREAPAVWAEVLCDFDLTGAGSVRGALDHFRDVTRGREALGIALTKRPLDATLTIGYGIVTVASRLLNRSVGRMRAQSK